MKTVTSLRQMLSKANRMVPIGATFEHYKGDLYKVTDLVINEETQKVMVIYTSKNIFKENCNIKFTRPIEEWYPRFQLCVKYDYVPFLKN